MLFPSCSCSYTLDKNSHLRFLLDYKCDAKSYSIAAKKIHHHPESKVPLHQLIADNKNLNVNLDKLKKRIHQLIGYDTPVYRLITKILPSVSKADDLCRLVEHTWNFMEWSSCITLEKEIPINKSTLSKVSTLRYHLRMLQDQFGPLLPALQDYLKDYEAKEIEPLMERIKAFLKSEPMRLSISAAAARGNALSAGIKACIKLESTQEHFHKSSSSRNYILLLENLGVVFKQQVLTSREEERNVESLFDLSMEDGIVKSFMVKKLASHRFGHQIFPYQEYQRGFSLTVNSLYTCDRIASRLHTNSDLIRWSRLKSKLNNWTRELKAITCQFSLSFEYELKNEKGICGFSTIRKMIQDGKFISNSLFGVYGNPLVTIEQFMNENPSFVKAINYEPYKNMHKNVVFMPHLKSTYEKNCYAECEQKRWRYLTHLKEWKTVSFKELQELWITGKIDETTFLHEEKEGNISTIEHASLVELRLSLDCDWDMFLPEVKMDYKGEIIGFAQASAKPFISDMATFEKFKYYEDHFIEMMNRLDEPSELAAVLTAEFQLLDLHDHNIGITPTLREYCIHFSTYSYRFGGKKDLEFSELLELYLKGKLKATDEIMYKENDQEEWMKKQILEIPNLLEALETRWKLVLFDFDLSMGETNLSHEYSVKFKNGTTKASMIPMRSDLLATRWKDKPLSMTTIEKLMDSERILRIRNWVEFKDAPIRKFLPKKFQNDLDKYLALLLEDKKYSTSFYKVEDKELGIYAVRSIFAKNLADLNENPLFWTILESVLNENEQIKVKKPYQLINDTNESKQKRIHIAEQLFPRFTSRQIQSLYERQDHCRNYLISYLKLSNDKLPLANRFKGVKDVLENHGSLFTLIIREIFSERIAELEENWDDEEAEEFCKTIITAIIPSYFNVCKVMYPLLADAFELAADYGNNEEGAGKMIGLYLFSIDELIDLTKTAYPETAHPLHRIALHLEAEVYKSSSNFRAIFGNFFSTQNIPRQVEKPVLEETNSKVTL